MTCTRCSISNPSVDTAFDIDSIMAQFDALVATLGTPVRRSWALYLNEGAAAADALRFSATALENQGGAVTLENTYYLGAATEFSITNPDSVDLEDCNGATNTKAS